MAGTPPPLPTRLTHRDGQAVYPPATASRMFLYLLPTTLLVVTFLYSWYVDAVIGFGDERGAGCVVFLIAPLALGGIVAAVLEIWRSGNRKTVGLGILGNLVTGAVLVALFFFVVHFRLFR